MRSGKSILQKPQNAGEVIIIREERIFTFHLQHTSGQGQQVYVQRHKFKNWYSWQSTFWDDRAANVSDLHCEPGTPDALVPHQTSP